LAKVCLHLAWLGDTQHLVYNILAYLQSPSPFFLFGVRCLSECKLTSKNISMYNWINMVNLVRMTPYLSFSFSWHNIWKFNRNWKELYEIWKNMETFKEFLLAIAAVLRISK